MQNRVYISVGLIKINHVIMDIRRARDHVIRDSRL
jgi:hypothetical protein